MAECFSGLAEKRDMVSKLLSDTKVASRLCALLRVRTSERGSFRPRRSGVCAGRMPGSLRCSPTGLETLLEGVRQASSLVLKKRASSPSCSSAGATTEGSRHRGERGGASGGVSPDSG